LDQTKFLSLFFIKKKENFSKDILSLTSAKDHAARIMQEYIKTLSFGKSFLTRKNCASFYRYVISTTDLKMSVVKSLENERAQVRKFLDCMVHFEINALKLWIFS